MTLAWLSILWVFGSVAVALLPLRLQYAPGIVLLPAAPVLITAMGRVHSWLLAALAACVSLFRNPLRYAAARLCGARPELSQ
ncbi:DUF2484 family protein [Sulfitobacter sp. PS-8MA]|uniref:DUF2484 family protein n=1 Tax=Sulfitobacter sp. PS-8MA TaxID=3237707 RepID=UPI0034C5CAE6